MSDGEQMNDSAGGRGEFVTFREHTMAKEEAAKVMAAIQLEQAAQRAALMHLPDDVRRLTDAVNGLGSRMQPAPGADANSLAMHHAATAMTEAVKAMTNRPSLATELMHALNTSKPNRTNGPLWAALGVAVTLAIMLGWKSLLGG